MNIIFLGPPGAGKGTVAAIVKEQLGLVHISTGDLFRSNIKNETVLGFGYFVYYAYLLGIRHIVVKRGT